MIGPARLLQYFYHFATPSLFCKLLKFRICHLASVPEGGKLCITAGEASVANVTCGLEYGKSISILEEGEHTQSIFIYGNFALFEDGFIIRRSIRRFPSATGYAEFAPFGDVYSSINT